MVRFEFGGGLRRYFSNLDMNVSKISDGLRLLFAQNIEFRKAFTHSKMYITINEQKISSGELEFSFSRRLLLIQLLSSRLWLRAQSQEAWLLG